MNNLVVFGGTGYAASAAGQRVVIDGVSLGCGLMPAVPRTLEPSQPESEHAVAVRVTALSCNYRDRTLIRNMRRVPASRFSAIGSEFAGVVTDVGPGVTTLRPGDRVIPDHHYAGGTVDAEGVREGIATNQASRRFQVLPARKLAAIPSGMPHETAAAFSLGAQTAYSIVRRLEVVPGAPALVTAGGSNTSLFVLAALRQAGAVVYATTSSDTHVGRLLASGADHVLVRPRDTARGSANDPLRDVAREIGGFAAVADPFFDLHLEAAVHVLRAFGRYATCGFAAQNSHLQKQAALVPLHAEAVFTTAIEKNLTLMGNCIGLSGDLARALADYESGGLAPVIDSVFEGGDVAGFFDRTYNDPSRFGKVVYRYEQ